MLTDQQPDEMQAQQPAQQPNAQEPAQPSGGAQQLGVVYRRLGIAAVNIIYDESVSKNIIEMLKTSGDPPHAIAQAAMGVLQRLRESVKGINPDNVYMVAPAVIVFICELGDAAGLFKAGPDVVQQATLVLQERIKEQGGEAEQETPEEQAGEPPGAEQAEAAQPPSQPQGLVQSAMGG